ncbi:hypothetical protein P4H66_25675 [Paenibacillus dokdonensis]|uniref:Glycosyl transferase family 2 n=1 Tax=Paenibacillus dokdonensis TaxID=2567944 RepID=A0ABU6GV02_9BACL|nr:hypothetical protein [Paenibacillus dokdonensis]MEC0243208.1 hypothetical protein [Paenibacillus dokdonensis]
MLTPLLWILTVYALAVAAVHVYHAWQKRKNARRIHYILVTSNHERQIEWYIRALGLYALMTGKRLRITVLDVNSDDHTLGIIDRLEGIAGVEMSVSTDFSVLSYATDPDVKIVDLRNPHEAGHIPYV